MSIVRRTSIIFMIIVLAYIVVSWRLKGLPSVIQLLKNHVSNLSLDEDDPIFEHAIVVPYRNRLYHLSRFKEHLGAYLKTNFANEHFSLWIVEQGDDKLFNRGWLGNVGIKEIKYKISHIKCVVFHDVDLIPAADGIPYNCCDFPTQLGSELEHFDWGIPYEKSFGGVVSMKVEHWININGFSNDYVGWGGEDDDLFERVRINGLLNNSTNTVYRPVQGRGRFKTISQSTIHHSPGVRGENEYAQSLEILDAMMNGSNRWKEDGLSDVHYTIVKHDKHRSIPGFSSIHHIVCIP